MTNTLVGTWKLVEIYIEFDDSHERAERLGANPVGYPGRRFRGVAIWRKD